MNRLLPIWMALLWCAADRAPGGEAGDVDDQALLQSLTRQAQQLQDAGQLAPFKQLREQLGRTTYPLRLPAPPRQTLTAPELYRRARPSALVHCLLYRCDKCQRMHVNISTCFPLTADGICVANYHAFTASNTVAMAVATRNGRVFPVTEVLAASARDDVVIFRTTAEKLTPLALAAAEVGEAVAVLSHPSNLFYVLTQGAVARYCLEKGVSRMQITADYAIGSSGGPVLNSAGAAVGMVAATRDLYDDPQHGLHGQHGHLQMVVKLCVPAASIRKLLKDSKE
ncbi:MAG: serine protease [Kiritimatiellaeota bacterium]|nr:serine protease [Kiritimatiellota bacterium]